MGTRLILRAAVVFGHLERSACTPLPWLIPMRGAKRKGVQEARKIREERLIAKGLMKPKLKKVPKKLTFLERVALKQKANITSPSLEHPARVMEGEEKEEESEDDVYLMSEFPPEIYSVAEAVELHRELMHPTMFNEPDAFVRLRLFLNMNLEQKKQYVSDVKGLVELPNPIQTTSIQRTILAFSKETEIQKQAMEAGAAMAGGPELVKKILKGQYRTDEMDFVVCHSDMLAEMMPLRGILKARFPTALNSALGHDMEVLVHRFLHGLEYEIKRDPLYSHWGLCDTIVAKLDMTTEQIEANIATFIQKICSHRPVTPTLGHFIHCAKLMVSPSSEHFDIDFSLYAPEIPAEEPTKKKAAAAQN